jgi:hypothetical protein
MVWLPYYFFFALVKPATDRRETTEKERERERSNGESSAERPITQQSIR